MNETMLPKTPLGVEVILHELLPDVDLEKYLDFLEDEQNLIIKIKQYLPTETWISIMTWVRGQGGDWNQPQKLWLVPKQTGPPADTSQPTDAPHEPDEDTPQTDRAQPSESVTEQKTDTPPTKEYNLKESIAKIGHLYPVLKDAYGNVIDGAHRLKDDSKWPIKTLDHIADPVQLVIARLVANIHRRDVPPEEKTTWLGQLASMTGWTPRQIAENLSVSYSWVMTYLSDEWKGKTWDNGKMMGITRLVIGHKAVNEKHSHKSLEEESCDVHDKRSSRSHKGKKKYSVCPYCQRKYRLYNRRIIWE